MADDERIVTRAWRHLERPVRILVYVLIALTLVMLFHQSEYLVVHLFNVLLLFVFAAIIALLLTPVIDRMETLAVFKGRRTIAVLLVYVVIIGLIAGVIALVTPALIGQAKQLPALESRAIAFVRALQDAIDNAGIPLKLSLPSGTAGISTVVLGILTFFLEFLPLIGAPIGMGLAVVIALVFKGPLVALLALVVALGGHAIEAYILGPRVTGSATRIHPLVAMAALLIGAELGGILGALFGVPIAALLNVFLGAFYRARRGEEAPLSASPSGQVHAEALPRLSEEISETAEEGPIQDKPVPHTAAER